MRWHFAAALAGLMVLLTAACETMGPNSDSGPDFERPGAIKVELDQLVLDRVSCIDGDKTDWKFFSVPSATKVAVTFAFDEPSAGGTLAVHQPDGELMKTLKFVPGSRMTYEFDANEGFYYLEFYCESYKSEYTLEVTTPG